MDSNLGDACADCCILVYRRTGCWGVCFTRQFVLCIAYYCNGTDFKCSQILSTGRWCWIHVGRGLKNSAGFDVIVFVPSYDEDLGLITCGNAILSGNMPKIKYKELK